MSAPDLSGWGAGPWGETPWGTGEPALALLSALAVRENAVQVEFTTAPLLDGLLTPHDASSPERFTINTVSGVSADGEVVRPVLPVLIEVAAVAGGGGRFILVWVDRPFTGYPAVYRVSANNLVSASGGSPLDPGASATFYGVRAGKSPPTPEHASASRDFLIAQTGRELLGSNVPGAPSQNLGNLPVDATGDYATGTPIAGYRTRVIRRAITALGSFSHLANTYGTQLPRSVKKPARPANVDNAAAQIEAQVRLEPETIAVKVTATISDSGVVRYRILARSRIGDVDVTVPG